MYDDIRVLYKLPVGGSQTEFQTKDTESQFCDQYELREDGTLWRHAYDSRFDPTKMNAFGVMGVLCCDNLRWEPELHNGELRFYTTIGEDGWLEYLAWMVEGKVKELLLIEHKEPTR